MVGAAFALDVEASDVQCNGFVGLGSSLESETLMERASPCAVRPWAMKAFALLMRPHLTRWRHLQQCVHITRGMMMMRILVALKMVIHQWLLLCLPAVAKWSFRNRLSNSSFSALNVAGRPL